MKAKIGMPSYFNLLEFKEKNQKDIETISEIFPQFDLDNIALCFYENNCDIGLTLMRLTLEKTPEPIPKIIPNKVEQQTKRNITQKLNSKKIQLKETASNSPISTSLKENPINNENCVIFLFSKFSSFNVESPSVIFPISTINTIISLPIVFS